MEPDFTWKLAFLVLGMIVPAAVMAADVIWFSANALVIIICAVWFGFFFFMVEGVTD